MRASASWPAARCRAPLLRLKNGMGIASPTCPVIKPPVSLVPPWSCTSPNTARCSAARRRCASRTAASRASTSGRLATAPDTADAESGDDGSVGATRGASASGAPSDMPSRRARSARATAASFRADTRANWARSASSEVRSSTASLTNPSRRRCASTRAISRRASNCWVAMSRAPVATAARSHARATCSSTSRCSAVASPATRDAPADAACRSARRRPEKSHGRYSVMKTSGWSGLPRFSRRHSSDGLAHWVCSPTCPSATCRRASANRRSGPAVRAAVSAARRSMGA